ncbi:MAG: hypothetical protein FJY92_01995, partial [Candidatus Hydrogenedentes bacterium]|nr:hypothetical protein [Candidatus Hydrogenedentota bacterium]
MNGFAGSFFAAAVGVAALAGAQDAPAPFRAGAAASNITPWLGVSIAGHMNNRIATSVHDELHARCLVLDDGATKIAFAIVDSCMVPREVVEDAKAQIQGATGIAPDHVLVSATHTHSAACSAPCFQTDPDPEYKRYLAVKISDGVRRAIVNLAPAKIAWGAGNVPDQVFNRRWKMKDGAIPPNPFGNVDKVQMNPPQGSENLIEPAGPTDPEVPFIFVKGVDDRPIALLANYSLHYVGGDGGPYIS